MGDTGPQNSPWGETTQPETKPNPIINKTRSATHPPLPWQDQRPPPALAYLIRLIETPGAAETSEDSKPFAIVNKELIIGSNPKAVNLALSDPSVDKRHARLTRREDGTFWITDLGSTAGTWVNYAPISPEGARLVSGDLLHVGRVGFRFTYYLEPKSQPRRAVISPAK